MDFGNKSLDQNASIGQKHKLKKFATSSDGTAILKETKLKRPIYVYLLKEFQ